MNRSRPTDLLETGRSGRGVVAVIVRDARFLVIRRSHLVTAPAHYCFPGGGVELGETDERAVQRELMEELSIDGAEAIRCVWRCRTPSGVALTWWLTMVAPDCRPVASPAEVAEVHWLFAEEILLLPQLLETNRRFLRDLQCGRVQL
ncbi:MAG: NUDIX domain-containing protein [Pirellulaceae bacterium]|nr:NUDIX domain-containing protein [Planctomycetales bacterium]